VFVELTASLHQKAICITTATVLVIHDCYANLHIYELSIAFSLNDSDYKAVPGTCSFISQGTSARRQQSDQAVFESSSQAAKVSSPEGNF